MRKNPPRRYEGSKLQIAEHLDITPPTLRKLIRDGTLPESGSLEDYARIYIKYLHKHAEARGGSTGELRRQKLELDIEVRKYEIAERQGMMVRVTDIMPEIERKLTTVRQRMLGVGFKVAALVDPGDPDRVKDIIDDAVNEALADLSGVPYERPERKAKPPRKASKEVYIPPLPRGLRKRVDQ